MSDGALSQDEIDALLAGVDSAGISGGLSGLDLGGSAQTAMPASSSCAAMSFASSSSSSTISMSGFGAERIGVVCLWLWLLVN